MLESSSMFVKKAISRMKEIWVWIGSATSKSLDKWQTFWALFNHVECGLMYTEDYRC